MSAIIKISKDGKSIVNKDALILEPNLKNVTEGDLIYIALAYDYENSLFRKLPTDQMKEKAIEYAYGKNYKKNPEDFIKIKAAIESFKALNYNELDEELRVYKDNHKKLLNELRNGSDLSQQRLTAIANSMKYYRSEIERIEKQKNIDEELLEIKGGKKLSWIEIWQRNRDKYNDRF